MSVEKMTIVHEVKMFNFQDFFAFKGEPMCPGAGQEEHKYGLLTTLPFY